MSARDICVFSADIWVGSVELMHNVTHEGDLLVDAPESREQTSALNCAHGLHNESHSERTRAKVTYDWIHHKLKK